MNKYRVIDRFAGVGPGALVEITKEQHRRRAHCLKKWGNDSGVYKVEQGIQFKVGEVFGFDGATKRMNNLEPMDAVKNVVLEEPKPKKEKPKKEKPKQ